MNRFLLCTDLDRTLISNGVHPESPSARMRFAQLVARKEIFLVYVTGRHRALIEEAMEQYELPRPDFAIADVGATIYEVDANGWRPWLEWDAYLAPDWRNLSSTDVHTVLRDFPELRLQEKEKQNHHKLSFYVPLGTNTAVLNSQMDGHLQQADIRATLIWSIDEQAGIGLLDVLPARAGKLHAIRFLMHRQNFLPQHTVFAGDSGNDLDVLLSDIPSVVVANADAKIKAATVKEKQNALYIAKGDYLGMNGNYSAGILEGVAHFWPEANAWLHELK